MRSSRPLVSVNSPNRTFSRLKLYAAVLAASQWMVTGQAWAAPEGGEVVGGEGIIQQAGVETLITQATERMAIDWRSFDVAANERVEFVQPSSSSIALNRVLSNRGSEILGRIDANGQVMLVNPNGIVFGKDSVVNVGGMIASGLNIDPTSFINGEFALDSIEGAEGKVINYGIINAATGGSVTLVGEQVQNDGLISAKLGAVNLVAGKAAVLTFDPSGMLGVKVSEAVVQDELGVDAAVINNGSINADGGRVLLSASVSEDVFTNAVNNAGMNKASSVVVHEDGSFTLGAGADVINTGDISTSVTQGDAGQVVMLGENITHSGKVIADAGSGTGGSIELHSADTTSLTADAVVSAQATARGEGGDIKVLGNKVGLFDTAEVNASGANGGGQVLVGGDKTGQNQQVRNADFIYLGKETHVKTDALAKGDGGKLITFASDSARIHGNLSARGGSQGGDGGFIETSGLKGFEILNTPDMGATAGEGGTWLIDPYNITIKTMDEGDDGFPLNSSPFISTSNSDLSITSLTNALVNGDVIVQTGDGGNAADGRIRLVNPLSYTGTNERTLTLRAHNGIEIAEGFNSTSQPLNLNLIADFDNNGTGNIDIDASYTFNTRGGDITATGVDFNLIDPTPSDNNNAELGIETNGGNITLNMTGSIDLQANTVTANGNFNATGTSFYAHNAGSTVIDTGTGNLIITANSSAHLGSIETNNLTINADGDLTDATLQAGNVAVTQEAGTALTVSGTSTFNTHIANTDNDNTGGNIVLANAGNTFTGNLVFARTGSVDIRDSNAVNLGVSNIDGDFTLVAGGNITQSAGVSVKNTTTITAGNFDVVLNNAANKFNTVNFTGAIKSLNLLDSEGGLSVGNITTQVNNQNGGNIVITNTAAGGALTLGTLTTTGGSAADNQAGKNGGNVTLSAQGAITAGAINTSGSAGNDNSNDGGAEYDGGVGGNVSITSASTVTLGRITTDGGNGDADGTQTEDDADGGNAGSITVTATEIGLTDSLFARGGRLEDYGTSPDKNNGLGGTISLTGNVKINNSTNPVRIDTTLVDTVISGSAVKSARPANLTINGNITGETAYADALTINAAQFNFTGTIGSETTALGDLSIAATNAVGAAGKDIFAKSLNINSNGFTAGNISTYRAGQAAGNILIESTGAINLGSIDAHGDAAAQNGGAVTLTGTTVNLGSINTSGDIGGAILIEANNSSTSKNITVSGDLNSQSTSGQGAIQLTLANTTTTGSINLNSTSFFSSNITVQGLGGTDTLKGPNTDNTWTFAAGNIGKITNTGNGSSKEVNFEGFENLTGGSLADTFNLTQNRSGNVNGGSGADIFNINVVSLDAAVNGDGGEDTFNINVATSNATLNGGNENDTFNVVSTGIVTATLTGGAGTDTIIGANKENQWSLGGTESLNGTIGFSAIENITGNSGKDIFTFNESRTVTGNIDAAGGTEDTISVLAGATIDYRGTGFSLFDVANAEVLSSQNGGTLTVRSDAGDTIDWQFITSGNSVTDGSNLVKVSGFTSYTGDSGSDIFTVEDHITFTGLINGGAGDDTFNLVNATNPYAIVIGNTYQAGSSATLLGINNINANNLADTSLGLISGANTWSITGQHQGTVSNSSIGTVNFSGVAKISGGSGSDSITTLDSDTNWSVVGENAGNIALTSSPLDVWISFSEIENLIGSSANDTFSFSNGASVVSAQGNDGHDIADLSNIAGPITITIGDATAFGFSGVERLIGNASGNFTLATSATTNAWRIENNGTIDGTVAGVEFVDFANLQGSTGVDTFDFYSDFAGTITGGDGNDIFNIRAAITGDLQGNNGADTFVFFDTGSINTVAGGSADAGGDAARDIIDLRQLTAGTTVTLTGTTLYNVANIERVIADSTKDFILAASSGTNTWTIANNGVIDGSVAGIEFTGFNNLRGGSGADTFNFSTDFTGTIDGSDGDDTFNITNAITSNLRGGLGVDTFNLNANSAGNIEGGSGNDIFNIRAAISGSLHGNTGADAFVFYDTGSINAAGGGVADAGTGTEKDVVDLHNITTDKTIILNGSTLYNVTNAERVIANDLRNFTLAATAATNSWHIYDIDGGAGNLSEGVNDGTVAGIEFINFRTLRGGSGTDTFDLDTNFSGTIYGLDGNDVFNIKTALTGNLQGGNGADTFVFYNVGSVAASNAGTDTATDVVDLRNITADRTVTISGNTVYNLADIERVIANDSRTFTLATTAAANTWTIHDFSDLDPLVDGINDGTVANIEFINFKRLQGGTGIDTFNLETDFTGTIEGLNGNDIFNINTAVTGALLGGTGADRFVFLDQGSIDTVNGGSADGGNDAAKDLIDLRQLTAGTTVTLSNTTLHNVAGIEQIIADENKDFTLAATSGTNTWNINDFDGSAGSLADGLNDGTVAGIEFINFNTLKGGAGTDNFVFIGTSASVETIDGGAGINSVVGRNTANTWTVAAAGGTNNLSVTDGNTYLASFTNIQNLRGGTGTDTFIINGTIGELYGNGGDDRFIFSSANNAGSASLIDGGAGDDQISGRNANNIWSITGTDAGNISVTSGVPYVTNFRDIQTLVGGSLADVFQINANITGSIQAGNGNNIFEVNTGVSHLQGGNDNDEFIFGASGRANSVNGGGGINSLYARDANNLWTITSTNAGNIRATTTNDLYVTDFFNIQALHGGKEADRFNINATAVNIYGNEGDDVFSFAENNNGIASLIDGGLGSNSLRGRNQASTWTMTGANSGSVSNAAPNIYVSSFVNIHTLIGSADADTLAGANQANSWRVTGDNQGELYGTATPAEKISFQGMENLLGNQGVDLFVFTANGNITGLIDGSTTATKNTVKDSLDLSALSGNLTVALGNQQTTALNVVNVEDIIASTNNQDNHVLIGANDTSYRWKITGQNQGVVETAVNPLLETSVNFVNFGDIRGGSNSDRFDVQGTITKSIDGGSGIDLVDYSQRKENFTIELGGSGGLGDTGINGIEGVVGNSASGNGYTSTIKVNSGDNIWEIGAASNFGDGNNDGSITINNNKISFENFTNLIGGSGRDTFNYIENGQWVGNINGGGGTNIVNASLSLKNQQFGVFGTVLSAGTNLSGINEVIGNANTASLLVSNARENTWQIDNQANGRLNDTLAFTNIANLQGGAFSDTFNIANLSWLQGVVDGGGGTGVDTVNLMVADRALQVAMDAQTEADINVLDMEAINANNSFANTLKGGLQDNEWHINGLNAGIFNGTLHFTGFANLIGNNLSDLVVFDNNAANLTGHIDLGDGQDLLDLSASGRDTTVQINASKNTLAAGILSVDKIEEIKGDANRSNRLIGDNYSNTWILDDVNAGRVSATETGTVTFSQFKHLTGGTGNDVFVFEALGKITGLVDGGEHAARDIVDLSKANDANVLITSTSNVGFINVERYIGNNIDSTLTAADVTNNWSLAGTNRGTLNEVIEFENFGVLKGGNRQDNFIINNATLSGSIDAGDGDDTFNIQNSAIAGKVMAGNGDDRFTFTIIPNVGGTADIDGGAGANRLTVEGGEAGYKSSHQLGRLEYPSATGNTYSILYSNVANIFDNVIADTLSIFGTASADTFRLQTARYNTNNVTTVNYTNKSNLVVNGSADDQVIVDGTVGVESTVTFNNLRVLAENSGKIQARSLELVNTGSVGSATARLNTAVNDLSLNTTNGAIYLEEQDGLRLGNFNVSTTDMVDIKAGGDLSTSGALAYSGDLNLESMRGDIELGNNNSLTGTLNLKAAGNITLDNLQALSLGEVVAQNATLGSGSSITGLGIFSVSGLATLNAASDITLLNADNDINQINIGRANNIELFDKNGFTTASLNVANDTSLRSSGGIILGTSCTTDCSGNAINTKNLHVQSAASVTVAKSISATESINIESQGMVVNDSVTSKQFLFNAGNGKLLLNESGNLLGEGGNNIELTANSLEQRSTIVSGGNITVKTAGDIVMADSAVIESLGADISLKANNLQLALLKSSSGAVNMIADGAITDGNGTATNIVSSRWQADAMSGIGVGLGEVNGADAIETDVGVLSVRNAGKIHSPASNTSINIANTNSLIIEQARNNGNISIAVANGDVILDNTHNDNFNPADTDARTQGGVLNANTGSGSQLFLTIGNGMVRAENKANKQNPDIIADIATFNFQSSFDFGERNRKIIMHVPEIYNQNSRLSFVAWYLGKPAIMNDLSKVPSDSLISGRDQLIEIEGLSEIDPAIFTSLRNYVHDEVAILLPADQRFDDEEDEL